MLGTLDKTVITPDSDLFKRVAYLEDQIRSMNQFLNQYFIQGRLRNNRPIPANSADVSDYDRVGDWIITPTFLYILVNDSGTIKWVRAALNTF